MKHGQFSSPNCAMIIEGNVFQKWFFYLHYKLTICSRSGPDILASTAKIKVMEKIKKILWGPFAKKKIIREIMKLPIVQTIFPQLWWVLKQNSYKALATCRKDHYQETLLVL